MPNAVESIAQPRSGEATAGRAAVAPGRRLSPGGAFLLVASITLTFLAGSSAPTPLYALYQARWGFSATMLTVVFGVYAIAVLASLLVVGRLSDHVGRRPVLLVATAVQAITMLIFAHAHGLPDLLIGRVLQGLSAGAAIAAVGATLLDIDRPRGAVANAVAPMSGTALGGVLAGAMVQFLPAPTRLVYLFLAVVFVAQGIGVWFIHETSGRRPGAFASSIPSLGVPAHVVGPLLFAVPALVAVWAIGGFYASLGPTLVHTLTGSNAVLLGGLALFVLAGCGALAVLALRRLSALRLMRIGSCALLVGVALALAGVARHSIVVFFVATTIAGVGFGAGFQGGLLTVVESLAPDQRARVLSVLFIVSYLSMGVPAIAAGYRYVASGDIARTADEMGSVVMVLAVVALVGTFRRRIR